MDNPGFDDVATAGEANGKTAGKKVSNFILQSIALEVCLILLFRTFLATILA